ncbi:MAG: hypothetical protein KDD55_12915 [Bdellovibrionales bacterium]|nr:hypothetical protein [Bdellovibrionales bacterium]
MLPGILGMALTLCGLLLPISFEQRLLFFLGALGPTVTAYLESHRLFLALQAIVLSGTVVAFVTLSPFIKASIPFLVAVPVLFLLKKHEEFSTRNDTFGALSLLLLSAGYATQGMLFLFLGGFAVSIYSVIEWMKGFAPALIWFALNLIFTILAGVNLLK